MMWFQTQTLKRWGVGGEEEPGTHVAHNGQLQVLKKKEKNVITVLLWITVIADKKSAHNVLAYLHVGTFQGHFK